MTYTLHREQVVPTAVPNLPNTGAGSTAATSGSNPPAMLMVIAMLAVAGGVGSIVQLRNSR